MRHLQRPAAGAFFIFAVFLKKWIAWMQKWEK